MPDPGAALTETRLVQPISVQSLLASQPVASATSVMAKSERQRDLYIGPQSSGGFRVDKAPERVSSGKSLGASPLQSTQLRSASAAAAASLCLACQGGPAVFPSAFRNASISRTPSAVSASRNTLSRSYE